MDEFESPEDAWPELFTIKKALGGLTSFPLVPDIAKKPRVRWGPDFLGENVFSPDFPDTIARGIACGSRSGNLLVIDVDVKKGKEGDKSLKKFGDLPSTLIVTTPSGGGHYYYRTSRLCGSKDNFYPGIDIKSEGGYVVAPGSRDHRGVYEILEDNPIAYLPAALEAIMPSPPRSSITLDSIHTDMSPDLDISEMLEKTVHYKRGPVWDSWRAVARGTLPLTHKTANDIGGGVDSYIRLHMFPTLLKSDPKWSSVPGEKMAGLMSASMSLFVEECSAIGTQTKWTPSHVAEKWEAARQYSQEVAETRIREASSFDLTPDTDSGLPWMVSRDGHIYVLKSDHNSYWPPLKSANSILATATAQWSPNGPNLTVPTKAGTRQMTLSEATQAFAMEVADVVLDYTTSIPLIEDDCLRLPAAPQILTPQFHQPINDWLEALGGPWLLDWVSQVPALDQASPALWIVGKSSIGKTLLACGLSRIWRESAQFVPAEDAFARFNAEIAQCPIVFADEKVPENWRGFTDIDSLKRLITSTSHAIEQKMKPKEILKGAVRVIVASNDLNAIRNLGRIDKNNVAALAQRFVFIRADKDTPTPRDFATSSEIREGWLKGGKIGEHCLWLYENRPVIPGDRLVIQSNSDDMVSALMIQPDKHSHVIRTVCDMVIRAAKMTEGELPALIKEGKVYLTSEAIRSHMLGKQEKALEKGAIGRVLASIGDSERTKIKGTWYRGISFDLLLEWAYSDGQPDELRKALQNA